VIGDSVAGPATRRRRRPAAGPATLSPIT